LPRLLKQIGLEWAWVKCGPADGSPENAGPDNGGPNCTVALLDTLLLEQLLYAIC